MLFKMLQVAIDAVDENHRFKLINHITSLVINAKELISEQEKKVFLSGIQFLTQLMNEHDKNREIVILEKLEKLSLGIPEYLFINSILINLKFSNSKISMASNNISLPLPDKRFIKSEKPGLLYKAESYSYIEDETLIKYGFKKDQWVRSKEGIYNIVFIKELASSQKQETHSLVDFKIKFKPKHLAHLKIWFPKKGTHPLGGSLNELRLIKQSLACLERKEQFYLLTDFSINENKDVEYVQAFCNKHGICLVTTSDIKKELDNKEWIDKSIQLKLFDIAMLELTHSAGHPVIASDLFRRLSPVLVLGAYSDIDTKVNSACDLAKLEPNDFPELLLNFDFSTGSNKLTVKDLNINFLYAKNTEHRILIDYRRQVYFNYINFDFIYNLNMSHDTTICKNTVKLDKASTDDFKNFARQFFLLNPLESPSNILNFRQELKTSLPKHYEMYFYFYVMALTGPIALLNSLFPIIPVTSTLLEEVSNFSLYRHSITLTEDNIDRTSDLSWTKIGADRLADKNDKIDKNIRIIQRIWRERLKSDTTANSQHINANELNIKMNRLI